MYKIRAVDGYVSHFRLPDMSVCGVGRNRRKNGPAKAAKRSEANEQRVRIDGG